MPFDVAIIGAGPAGLACGTVLAERGVNALLVDEQPGPGGQVWRNIEAADRFEHPSRIWSDYETGRATVERFRQSGCAYRPATQLWQVEPGQRLFLKRGGVTDIVEAGRLVLAVGAQERPMPFAGWQLPGVMTVGAAQILLKTSGLLPESGTWLAGSGPLLLYFANQMLSMGRPPAGIVDLRPVVPARPGPLLAAASAAPGALLAGLGWISRLRRHGIPVIRARSIAALGGDRLQSIEIVTASDEIVQEQARLLLIHDGVQPRTHEAAMAGIAYRWDKAQTCLVAPRVGDDAPVLTIGDGARIGGAKAALCEGYLTGLTLAAGLGKCLPADASLRRRHEKELAAERSLRSFLDGYYPARPLGQDLADDALVCRCEEVSAATVRRYASEVSGIDELKARTRIGMGPCQGRNCAVSAARLLAAYSGHPQEDFAYRARPPARPIRISELAALPPEAKP